MGGVERPTAVLLGLGFAAGVLGALLGIGGGTVIVPALALHLGRSLPRAVGTSLAVIFPAVLLGAALEACWGTPVGPVPAGTVVWGRGFLPIAALALAAGSLPGSWIGAWLADRLGEKGLRRVYGLFLLVVALRMAWSGSGGSLSLAGTWALGWLAGAGVLAGVCASLFGIGGGAVAVPALALGTLACAPDALGFHAARATSLGMAAVASLAALVLHGRRGHVLWRWALPILPSALVGQAVGVVLAREVPGDALRAVFACYLVLCAVRFLRRSGATGTD